MLLKLKTGSFAESVQLGLDELEAELVEISNSGIVEDTNKDNDQRTLPHVIAAALIDAPFETSQSEPAIKGTSHVEPDNRYDTMRFSEEGWFRSRLKLAIDGLNASQAEETRTRVEGLVEGVLDAPADQLAWLLSRLPDNALSTRSMKMVAEVQLKREQFLSALFIVNLALSKDVGSIDLKLLKSKIYLEGGDLLSAKRQFESIDLSLLRDEDRKSAENLLADLESKRKSEASSTGAASTWGSVDSQQVHHRTTVSQANISACKVKYRLPFDFSVDTAPEYHSLRLMFCPWGNAKEELEIRNSRGQLVRALQIRANKGGAFGYASRCKIDIQNHLAELTLNKLTYFTDWFQVIAGESPALWKVPFEQVSPTRTATIGRETIVADGRSLSCFDAISGKEYWRRRLQKSVKSLVPHGDSLVTLWSEQGRVFNTVDTTTGRLVRSIKSERAIVDHSYANRFWLSHPLRKGELSKESAERFAESSDNPAAIAKRYLIFDCDRGEFAFEKVLRPDSRLLFSGREVCVLDPDGLLVIVSLMDGETLGEVNLPLSELQKGSVEGFSVRQHGKGWVGQVRCKDRSSRFTRGTARYRYRNLHGAISSGPVFLLDETRTTLLWETPVYLERMEYLDNQPFDSPFILFGRHIERKAPVIGETHHMQTVILDARDGSVVGSEIMKTRENYNGHAIEWEVADSEDAIRKLVITTPIEKQEFTFSTDLDLPPVPKTHLTFNAMDFFDDPVFKLPHGKIVDVRNEEFRLRAETADQQREKRRAKAAIELKKKMNVTDN
jgi:hypothetical protein